MRVATLLDAVEAIQGVPLQQQQLAQFLLGKAAAPRIEAARDTLFRAADAAYTDVESSGKGLSVNRRSECSSRCHSRPKRVPKLCASSMSSALRQCGSRNRSSGISAISTS